MKSIVCLAPHQIIQERRAAPGKLLEGWVLLDVSHVGICGTDYHIYEGKHPFLEYPRVIGHEISGVVSQAHPSSGFAAGETVVVNPYLSCGVCGACRKGKPNCCERIEVLGVHRDGGMCEQIAVPATNLYHANGLSPRDAAMVEFLAIGAHAVRRAGEKDGVALIVGAGPIGLGVAIFARIAGLDVTIADVDAGRLTQAQRVLGEVRSVVVGDAEALARVQALEPGGFDVVFDATGNARSIMSGFSFVAHGGTYVLVSVVKDDITFSDPEFHKREMSLIGSRNATAADFEHVIASIGSGAVPLDALATHETTLDTVVTDLPRWAREKEGLIKALVRI
ncbi:MULTISPECIES: zinc-binding alcohol dehydrogenase family protein [unclassified Chelatococcus]|uniref:zinc-binding alcohol dehydrogenase family protein n=1 Tax=unclassified Chelatococcus TaxID=2638111 RepID=UPI001BCFDFCD|nr:MULTISPECIES: zinc-binding alcohol dehydrogenase family protein [unclassified Chelatococcus]MBS7699814.1 zinc-binding alcohol dehydrogenase family protein [Chelatococcus sp. YT9]MBX3558160.1 zinc-binding alcohol dehydrogenase family protein [Chelatococcus sp.]